MKCKRCGKRIEKDKEAWIDRKVYCQECDYKVKHPDNEKFSWLTQLWKSQKENGK